MDMRQEMMFTELKIAEEERRAKEDYEAFMAEQQRISDEENARLKAEDDAR